MDPKNLIIYNQIGHPRPQRDINLRVKCDTLPNSSNTTALMLLTTASGIHNNPTNFTLHTFKHHHLL